jgi:voltage-gated sodium channel type II alpha
MKDDKQLFKKLTPKSISKINERLDNIRLQKALENDCLNPTLSNFKFKKNKNLISNQKNVIKPSKDFETGNKLSKKYKRTFPPKLTGLPLEEIDDYFKNDYVFLTINNSRQIFRFNCKKSLYIFDPFSRIRQCAIHLLTHSFFNVIVIVTILFNCIIMAMPAHSIPDWIEYVFTAIYTCESIIKIVARGFIMNRFSYLRDPWNWIDFIVITLAYLTIFISSLGNLSVLRTLRVLRALKTVAIVPGLKTIVDSLIQSVIRLRDVMILTCFILSVFALVGLQLYMGVLNRKCVRDGDSNFNHTQFNDFVNNKANWIEFNNGGINSRSTYILCGNASGALKCPVNSTCLPDIGDNPNDGYTNFDTYGYSMLSSFRLMTQDYWENLYYLILTAEGPFQVFYFICVIFLGSFYLINLILAIVALSYREQHSKQKEEAEKKEEEIKNAAAAADVNSNKQSSSSSSCQFNESTHPYCLSVSSNSLINLVNKKNFDEKISLANISYSSSNFINTTLKYDYDIPFIDDNISNDDDCLIEEINVINNIEATNQIKDTKTTLKVKFYNLKILKNLNNFKLNSRITLLLLQCYLNQNFIV